MSRPRSRWSSGTRRSAAGWLTSWDRRPSLRHSCSFCVLAALHDVGKTNQGFQNRAVGEGIQTDHLTPIIGTIDKRELWDAVSEALRLERIYDWFGDMWDAKDWLQVTWSHHGAPVEVGSVKQGCWTDAAICRLKEASTWPWQWYPEAFTGTAPPLTEPRVQHAFNGALTLADWIGSDSRFFRTYLALLVRRKR